MYLFFSGKHSLLNEIHTQSPRESEKLIDFSVIFVMGSKHSFCGPTVFHVGVGGGDKEMAKWLLLLILCNSQVFLERKQCHVAVTKCDLVT